MEKQGLKAIIFGATGATGSELVQTLLKNPKWAKVHCVVRKQLPEWSTLQGKQKLTLQKYNDLDQYFKIQDHPYNHFDSLFCCFGSQVKHGEDLFVKIDKTYPLYAADIAKKYNIPHYLLVSSSNSDPKSWFLYMRTKGQAQSQLMKKELNLLSIFKPGLIVNRKDARTGQKILKYLPFIPKIQSMSVSESLRIAAEKFHQSSLKMQNGIKIFENSDMLNLLK